MSRLHPNHFPLFPQYLFVTRVHPRSHAFTITSTLPQSPLCFCSTLPPPQTSPTLHPIPHPNTQTSHVSNATFLPSQSPSSVATRTRHSWHACAAFVRVFPLPLVWSAVLWIHDSSEANESAALVLPWPHCGCFLRLGNREWTRRRKDCSSRRKSVCRYCTKGRWTVQHMSDRPCASFHQPPPTTSVAPLLSNMEWLPFLLHLKKKCFRGVSSLMLWEQARSLNLSETVWALSVFECRTPPSHPDLIMFHNSCFFHQEQIVEWTRLLLFFMP